MYSFTRRVWKRKARELGTDFGPKRQCVCYDVKEVRGLIDQLPQMASTYYCLHTREVQNVMEKIYFNKILLHNSTLVPLPTETPYTKTETI